MLFVSGFPLLIGKKTISGVKIFSKLNTIGGKTVFNLNSFKLQFGTVLLRLTAINSLCAEAKTRTVKIFLY